MAHIEKTFFEVKNSNLMFDGMQNIAGTFVSGDEPDICPSGFLCVKKELMDCTGYSGIKNGNTWVFEAAENGKSKDGALPEIFAFNSCDANKVAGLNGNRWYVGAETAGLELPAGEVETFTRIKPGEIYRFGEGNFSTLPASLPDCKYVKIENGLLVASSSAFTARDGIVFEILSTAKEV